MRSNTDNDRNNDNRPDNTSLFSSSSPFDVVVLDYRMPKKDGTEVAKEILDLNPNQRIIFESQSNFRNEHNLFFRLRVMVFMVIVLFAEVDSRFASVQLFLLFLLYSCCS
jgi:CheY-like chemotaxis protein